jgi:hypothetical protein
MALSGAIAKKYVQIMHGLTVVATLPIGGSAPSWRALRPCHPTP